MLQELVTGGPRCQSAATVGSIAGLLCAPGANQIAFNRMVTRLWRRLIKSSGHRRACAHNIGSAVWQHTTSPLLILYPFFLAITFTTSCTIASFSLFFLYFPIFSSSAHNFTSFY